MSIEFDASDILKVSKGIFSKRSLQNYIVVPIMRYYGLDDSGEPYNIVEKNKIKSFNILDFFQYSYDDMYKDIEKVLKSVSDEKKLEEYPEICKKIENFFDKYKGKKSPDKKKFANFCRSKYRKKGKSNLLKNLKRYYLKGSQVDLYDVMAIHIQEKVLSFPDNKMLVPSQIGQLTKIIDKYKSKLSQNKKEYIENIYHYLVVSKEISEQVNSYVEKGEKNITRDLVFVIRYLANDDDLSDIKKTLTRFANELAERNIDEVNKEEGAALMNKYKSKS